VCLLKREAVVTVASHVTPASFWLVERVVLYTT